MKFTQLSFLLFLFAFVLVGCDKDETEVVADSELAYLLDASEDEVVDALVLVTSEETTEARRHYPNASDNHTFSGDCFSLVFPVDVAYPDGSTTTALDMAELRQQVRSYLSANPGNQSARRRPMLVYPLTIQLEDGTLETVDSRRALLDQLMECRPNIQRCYSLLFPVEVMLGRNTVQVASAADLRDAIARYRAANPNAPRPTLVFPLNFETLRGDTVSINNAQQVQRLRRSCQDTRPREACFEFVYPITLEHRNGQTLVVETDSQLRRAFSHANPRGRWSFVFPITVTVDGEPRRLTSAEGFRRLRQACP